MATRAMKTSRIDIVCIAYLNPRRSKHHRLYVLMHHRIQVHRVPGYCPSAKATLA